MPSSCRWQLSSNSWVTPLVFLEIVDKYSILADTSFETAKDDHVSIMDDAGVLITRRWLELTSRLDDAPSHIVHVKHVQLTGLISIQIVASKQIHITVVNA